MRNQSIRTLKILGPSVAAALFVAGGCTSHGDYTSQHISAAREKMTVIKSATEWEMARQSFLSGDLDKAIKTVDRSIAMNSSVPKSHTLRGRILMEQGNLEEAINSFNRALAIDPQHVDAAYYLGIAYERLLQTDKALEQYKAAADLEPANAQYAVAAAEMMITQNHLEEADAYLRSRRSAFEHNAGVRQTLGHIAMMTARAEEAVELFNEARLLAPDDQGIMEDLIRAQMTTGKYGEAESNLAKLLSADTNKNRRDLSHMRASCLIAVQRPMEAREILIKLTTGDEGAADSEAWLQLGTVSYTLKDANRTRVCAARVIALAPQRPEGYVLKGLQLRRQGDLEGARVSLQRASELDKGAGTLVLRGMVERDLGRLDEARSTFQTALAIDPSNAEAQNLLAAVNAVASVQE